MRSPRHVLGVLLGVVTVASVASAHEGTNGSKFPGVPLPARTPGSSPYSPSRGVRVLAHVDPGGGFNTDVVAHNGFAYLGSWGVPSFGSEYCPSQGVRIYDLADPRHPRFVSSFGSGALEPDLAGTWTEKVLVRRVRTPFFRGDLAVASLQTCYGGDPDTHQPVAGFGVWDVTNPARPVRLGLYRSGTAGVHEFWLQARGARVYAYVAIPLSEVLTGPDANPPFQFPSGPGAGDFRIVDLTDPTHPVEVSQWGAWRNLGVLPYPEDGASIDFAHSVFGADNLAYVSYWDLGTLLFDVSNPSTPRLLGRTVLEPRAELHAHSSWLANDGRLLIQTSEDFSPEVEEHSDVEAAWGYVRFFDVSRPAAPRQISTFELPSTRPPAPTPGSSAPPDPQPPGYFSVHDPKVVDQTAFFSWYSEGVVAVDITCPQRPRQIAQFVPEPAADPTGFFGDSQLKFPLVWGTFPYQDYVLASDVNSGLWVFELQKRKEENGDGRKRDNDRRDDDRRDDDRRDDDRRDKCGGRDGDGDGRGSATLTAMPTLGGWGAPSASAALLVIGLGLGRRRPRRAL